MERAADAVDPVPAVDGELGRVATLLRLSVAVNLFHRTAVLIYGPGSSVRNEVRRTPFDHHRAAHPRVFWACFWIDVVVRLLVLLVVLGLAVLIISAAVAR